jgi:hypothetical protein
LAQSIACDLFHSFGIIWQWEQAPAQNKSKETEQRVWLRISSRRGGGDAHPPPKVAHFPENPSIIADFFQQIRTPFHKRYR